MLNSPKYTIEGTQAAGYWINAGPGLNRASRIYATVDAAQQAMEGRARLHTNYRSLARTDGITKAEFRRGLTAHGRNIFDAQP